MCNYYNIYASRNNKSFFLARKCSEDGLYEYSKYFWVIAMLFKDGCICFTQSNPKKLNIEDFSNCIFKGVESLTSDFLRLTPGIAEGEDISNLLLNVNYMNLLWMNSEAQRKVLVSFNGNTYLAEMKGFRRNSTTHELEGLEVRIPANQLSKNDLLIYARYYYQKSKETQTLNYLCHSIAIPKKYRNFVSSHAKAYIFKDGKDDILYIRDEQMEIAEIFLAQA